MPVSNDDVIWCYRNLLRREPESADALRTHAGRPDWQTLVRSFIESGEFKRKQGAQSIAGLDASAGDIETTATPDQLAALMARTEEAWSQLGVERPYHSVLTNPRFLPDAFEQNEEAFWASGERAAAGLSSILARHALTDTKSKTLVEYGCGVGRVTIPLAARFAKVYGYDISQNHLDLARQRASDISNIEFRRTRQVSERLVPCDVFYSRIVFQHNPPPVIRGLISKSLVCLKPNGIAIFQVPTFKAGYSFSINAYLNTPSTGAIEMHFIPQSEVFDIIARAGCRVLEVREDDAIGLSPQLISNTFIVRRLATR